MRPATKKAVFLTLAAGVLLVGVFAVVAFGDKRDHPAAGWLGVLTLGIDITERRLMEQHVEAKSDELARSNKDLEQFAYVTSHDLKAPLRGIANLATWLF